MFIVTHRKYFYAVSLTLIAASVILMLFFGFNLGIDFTGGTELHLEYKKAPPGADVLAQAFYDSGISGVTIQAVGERDIVARFPAITPGEHEILLKKLAEASPENGEPVEKRFTTIGPVIGKELRQTSVKALVLAILFIMLYIAWAFRHVSTPVSSWKYGTVAIAALLHDICIPTGFFIFLGSVSGARMDMLFITALLTILGFSVHDTIVVFDRIREKLIVSRGRGAFEDIVGQGIRETITRSINTSLTTVMVLMAVYLFGGETTRNLSLLLMTGIIVGTYSSIFIASPLLVTLEKFARGRSASG